MLQLRCILYFHLCVLCSFSHTTEALLFFVAAKIAHSYSANLFHSTVVFSIHIESLLAAFDCSNAFFSDSLNFFDDFI